MVEPAHTDPVERARQGSTAAVAALYEKHHLTIFRYLYYRTGDTHTAEDLTSEVFIRMIRSISSYQPLGVPFTAWLFQIARNITIDHFRKNSGAVSVTLNESVPAQGDMASVIDRRLDNQHLVAALKKLNEDQRDVIVLRFLAGMPIAEVSETLGKSENAVKGLQRRALMSLRQVLTEEEISHV